PFTLLFSESTGRAMVSVPRGHEKAFLALCVEREVPYTPLGVVDSRSGALDVRGLFRIPLAELQEAWSGTLPALFEGVAAPAVDGDGDEAAGADPADADPDDAAATAD